MTARILSATISACAGVAGTAQEHAELVAAEPRGRVGGAQDRAQPLAHLAEQLVAGVVAERVVELLEAVEIEQQQRQAGVARVGRRRWRRAADAGSDGGWAST